MKDRIIKVMALAMDPSILSKRRSLLPWSHRVELAKAVYNNITSAGYWIAPIEPTDEMISHSQKVCSKSAPRAVWPAMREAWENSDE